MELWEISTGFEGCSFERSYVWAESKARALELFATLPTKDPLVPRKAKECVLIMSRDEGEFITQLDDEGFGCRTGA